MTREQYHKLAPKFDYKQYMAQQEINSLSLRLNPTGDYYKQRVRDIKRKWGVTL